MQVDWYEDKAFSLVIPELDWHLWSASLYTLLGLSADTEPGSRTLFSQIHPEDQPLILEQYARYEKSGEIMHQNSFRIITPQGEVKQLFTHSQEERGPNGRKALLVLFYETESLIREMKVLNKRFESGRPYSVPTLSFDLYLDQKAIRRASKMAGMGWWEYDVIQNQFVGTDEVFYLLQKDRSHITNCEQYRNTLHPEDLEKWEQIYNAFTPADTMWHGVLRHVLSSGKLLHAQTFMEMEWAGDQMMKIFCVFQDISDRHNIEEKLRNVQRIAKVGWYELDLQNHTVLSVSDEYRAMHNLPATADLPDFEEFMSFGHIKDVDFMKESESSRWTNVQYKVLSREGRILYLDSAIHIERSPVTGEMLRLLGVTRDMTEQKESELYLREAQEIANIGWFEWNPKLRISRVSDKFMEIHRMEHDTDVIGRGDFFTMVHPEDKDALVRMLEDPHSIDKGFEVEYRIHTPEGHERHMVSRARRTQKISGGEDIRVIGIVQDVTERRQTEFRLKRAQRISKTGWFEYNLTDPAESRFSEEWLHMYELPEDYIPTGKELIRMLFPDKKNPQDFKAFLSKLPLEWDNMETRVTTIRGNVRFLSNTSRLTYNKEGEPIRLFGTSHDITDIRTAQEAMRQSERRYRLLSESSSDVVFLMEGELGNTHITFVSDYVKKLLGYDKTEMIGTRSIDYVHPEDAHAYVQQSVPLLSSGHDGVTISFRLRKKSGSYVWTEAVASHFRDEDRTLLLMSVRDVSDRKKIELELIKASTDLKALIKSTDQVVYIINSYQTFENVIARDESILPYPIIQFLHKPITMLWTDEVGLRLIELVREVFITRQSAFYEYEYRVHEKMDWYKASVHYFKGFDKKDRVTVYVEVITRQKEVEAELQRSVKMERELARMRANFVSMASHQFRTPLTVIKSNMQLLDSARVDHPVVTRVSARLIREVDRLVNLMEDILILGRVQSDSMRVDREEFDLLEMLEDIKRDVDLGQPDGRELKICAEKSIMVYLDKTLMRHATLNLITNAFKYSAQARNPEVHLTQTNGHVDLCIVDFGIGIPKEDQSRIFKDFFRADNVKEIQGTGLGLSIASEFLQLNRCELHMESELRKGTTFQITIPQEYVN